MINLNDIFKINNKEYITIDKLDYKGKNYILVSELGYGREITKKMNV